MSAEPEEPLPASAEPDLEFSALGGLITRDERTVQVIIFRIAGSGHGWAMEVVDINNTTTSWDTLFATEREAYEEFNLVLDEKGIAVFLGPDELAN